MWGYAVVRSTRRNVECRGHFCVADDGGHVVAFVLWCSGRHIGITLPLVLCGSEYVMCFQKRGWRENGERKIGDLTRCVLVITDYLLCNFIIFGDFFSSGH